MHGEYSNLVSADKRSKGRKEGFSGDMAGHSECIWYYSTQPDYADTQESARSRRCVHIG